MLQAIRLGVSEEADVSEQDLSSTLPPLSVRVENVGDLHRVLLRGELDMASATDVEARLVETAGSTVEVDLSQLTFIDARGIRALLSAKCRTTREGDHLRIVGATGMVRRVFTLLDLDGILDD